MHLTLQDPHLHYVLDDLIISVTDTSKYHSTQSSQLIQHPELGFEGLASLIAALLCVQMLSLFSFMCETADVINLSNITGASIEGLDTRDLKNSSP